jgi:ribosomal silencing factor RsfS
VTSEQLVESVADLAAGKKALDIVELDLRGAVDYTDYS